MNGSQELKNHDIAQNAKVHIGKQKERALTQERVKEVFDYRDGELVRILSILGTKIEEKVGYITTAGYSVVYVDKKKCYVHRLIWLWHYGYLPENGIDHIDRNKANNVIDNLREISKSCNAINGKIYRTNNSGIKGISWSRQKNKWEAYITYNQKTIHLGKHRDFTEAVAHRLAAEQANNWEGCDSSSSAYRYIKKYLWQVEERAKRLRDAVKPKDKKQLKLKF